MHLLQMPKFRLSAVIALLILVVLVAAHFRQEQGGYYAKVVVDVPENLTLLFLQNPRKSIEECQSTIATIADTLGASCPACKVTSQICTGNLELETKVILSADPVPIPTSRLANGMVGYLSTVPEIALSACVESEKLTKKRNVSNATCYAPNSARPDQGNLRSVNDTDKTSIILLVVLLSFLTSSVVGYLIIRYEDVHRRWSQDEISNSPQKFHTKPTSRIGGINILLGLLVSGMLLLTFQNRVPTEDFGFLILAGIPCFLGGIAEDVTKRVRILPRLLFTMLSAAIGIWLLGATIGRSDVPGLDLLLLWAPFAMVLTLIAVSGIANAFNIIDGYNGLAGGCSIIILVALALVSAAVHDTFLMVSALAMIGALLGFMVWNYPSGKIFLGDGGAYLVGFWIAEISVLLFQRHSEVSPWFPILLIAYPIVETLFSIYRKKILRGKSPGHPDGLHLHMLFYKRLVKAPRIKKDSRLLLERNSKVAKYSWALTLLTAVPAVLFWKDTGTLAVLSILFCVIYIWLYRRIATWRAPRLLHQALKKPDNPPY